MLPSKQKEYILIIFRVATLNTVFEISGVLFGNN